MISIFDMCTAREDRSNFFLDTCTRFLLFAARSSADTTTLNLGGLFGRFQQKQTVEHLEGLVIGTGPRGDGGMDAIQVRQREVPFIACIDVVFLFQFRTSGLFGEKTWICYLRYIYIHIVYLFVILQCYTFNS